MPPRGQTWTTLEFLSQSHMNSFHEYDSGLIGIGAGFAIGQRALLVRTEGGSILWDCVAALDAATVSMIKGLGGLKASWISHPLALLHNDERMGAGLRLSDPSQSLRLFRDDPNRHQGLNSVRSGYRLVRCCSFRSLYRHSPDVDQNQVTPPSTVHANRLAFG